MGYFSQRKKHARQNMFMLISLLILAVIYFCLWLDDGSNSVCNFFRDWQFHIYLYNIFLFVYTLFHRRTGYAVLAVFLMFLNYGSLAKSARLFFNQEPTSSNRIDVVFHVGDQNYQSLVQDKNIARQGKMELSPNLQASFLAFEEDNRLITLINLDFPQKYQMEYATAFHNLEKFVSAQNGPVIIVGDFGVPSWSPIFRKFLKNTDLNVKNRILFTDGKQSFRFFFIPTINILGFDNLGIEKLLMKGKDFHIRLSY